MSCLKNMIVIVVVIVVEIVAKSMGVSVADKKYERPTNPSMSLIADAKTEMI